MGIGKKILFAVAVLIVLIQFIPYGKEHTNPPVKNEPKWDSVRTKEYKDVQEGRKHFNVSNWGYQQKNEGDEAAEEFNEGEMPPLLYLLAHPDARLSKKEKEELLKGLIQTFGSEDD